MTNEELAVKIQNGERDLISDLWEQNVGLLNIKAFSLYDRYRDRCASSGVELDDIVQVCYFALCDAVQAFKADGEYKLTSYIKFPLVGHFNTLMGWRTSKRDALNLAASLNEPVGDDDSDTTRLDLLTDPNSDKPFETVIDNLFQSELHDALEDVISKLPANRAAVIRGRYFEDKLQGELAAEMNVSQGYVHTLEQEAFAKLRRERRLRVFHDEILSNLAYKRTGFSAFKEYGESSVEYAVVRAEEMTNEKRSSRKARFRN